MHVTLYGGFAEKGRTSIGVESGGYRLLLDAGVNTSARRGAGYYPALDADALRALDAMIGTRTKTTSRRSAGASRTASAAGSS